MIGKRFVPVLKWLGYSRRERRASLILLCLIIAVLIIKNAVPPVRFDVSEIAFMPPPASAKTTSEIRREQKTVQQKTELNSADSAKLVLLPGIGPVLAGRIVRFRNLLGGFVSVNQLREVYGLKEETFLLIRDRIEVDSTLITPVRINSAGYVEMVRHPYLEPPDVKMVLKYRELKGTITDRGVIIRNNLIDSTRMRKIRAYLRYD